MASGPFIDDMTTNEAELAGKLGVPRETLKDLRKDMTPGKHWTKEKGRIVYTPEGIKELEKAMGLREVPEGFYFEEKEYKEVTVKRSGFPNRKVLLCVDAEGEELLVRVRDNSNYRPVLTNGEPMVLKVRRDGDGWVKEGRGPRYVGRW